MRFLFCPIDVGVAAGLASIPSNGYGGLPRMFMSFISLYISMLLPTHSEKAVAERDKMRSRATMILCACRVARYNFQNVESSESREEARI